MTDKLHLKNKINGQHEVIVQHDMEVKVWGLEFSVDSELDAYKAAYEYRYNAHGVKVDFAEGSGQWKVIVFNEFAKSAGITA